MTWASSVPILVFLGLSVLDLGPMYATDKSQTSDRQTSDRRQTASSLNAPPIRGGGIIKSTTQSLAARWGGKTLCGRNHNSTALMHLPPYSVTSTSKCRFANKSGIILLIFSFERDVTVMRIVFCLLFLITIHSFFARWHSINAI